MTRYLKVHSLIMFVFLSIQYTEKYGDAAMSRILNGEIVDISERPYQVALVNGKNHKIVCGGALVKPRVIFTAAHCTHVSDFTPRKNLFVLVGINYVKDPDGKKHNIQKIIKHPDFSFSSFENDISIILLKTPVQYNEKAQAIAISPKEHSEGTKATASGWGKTEFDSSSRYLRIVKVTLENHKQCQKYFPKIYHPTITEDMVCTKPNAGSTYYGDSGGPLVVDAKLVGLVSFGRTVYSNKKITVFTKVKNYLDFAETVIPSEDQEEKI